MGEYVHQHRWKVHFFPQLLTLLSVSETEILKLTKLGAKSLSHLKLYLLHQQGIYIVVSIHMAKLKIPNQQ